MPDETEKPEAAERGEPDRDRQGTQRALASGWVLVGSVLVGLAIGWAVDAARGSSPLWTVLGAVVFMLIGFYHVVKDSFR